MVIQKQYKGTLSGLWGGAAEDRTLLIHLSSWALQRILLKSLLMRPLHKVCMKDVSKHLTEIIEFLSYLFLCNGIPLYLVLMEYLWMIKLPIVNKLHSKIFLRAVFTGFRLS